MNFFSSFDETTSLTRTAISVVGLLKNDDGKVKYFFQNKLPIWNAKNETIQAKPVV